MGCGPKDEPCEGQVTDDEDRKLRGIGGIGGQEAATFRDRAKMGPDGTVKIVRQKIPTIDEKKTKLAMEIRNLNDSIAEKKSEIDVIKNRRTRRELGLKVQQSKLDKENKDLLGVNKEIENLHNIGKDMRGSESNRLKGQKRKLEANINAIQTKMEKMRESIAKKDRMLAKLNRNIAPMIRQSKSKQLVLVGMNTPSEKKNTGGCFGKKDCPCHHHSDDGELESHRPAKLVGIDDETELARVNARAKEDRMETLRDNLLKKLDIATQRLNLGITVGDERASLVADINQLQRDVKLVGGALKRASKNEAQTMYVVGADAELKELERSREIKGKSGCFEKECNVQSDKCRKGCKCLRCATHGRHRMKEMARTPSPHTTESNKIIQDGYDSFSDRD